MEYIELDDNGKKIKSTILHTFGVDDKDYASLLDEEKDELYILELIEEDDETIFKTIDDEENFIEILAIYKELLEDEED